MTYICMGCGSISFRETGLWTVRYDTTRHEDDGLTCEETQRDFTDIDLTRTCDQCTREDLIDIQHAKFTMEEWARFSVMDGRTRLAWLIARGDIAKEDVSCEVRCGKKDCMVKDCPESSAGVK